MAHTAEQKFRRIAALRDRGKIATACAHYQLAARMRDSEDPAWGIYSLLAEVYLRETTASASELFGIKARVPFKACPSIFHLRGKSYGEFRRWLTRN